MRIKVGLALLLCFTFSLLLTGMVWAAEGDMWLEPNTVNVAPGQTFSLKLYADSGAKKLGAYQIKINFNKDIIEPDTTKGDSGMEAGDNALGNNFSNPNTPGEWRLSGFDVGGKQGNRLHLLTLYFKAKAEGTTNISITIEAMSDELGNAFGSTNATGATVNVAAAPVPKKTLTINKNMTGGVTITSSPDGINCTNQTTCSAEFNEGSTVTLTVTKKHPSYEFSWDDACASCGNSSTCNVTLDTDKTCSINIIGHASVNSAVGGARFDVYAFGSIEAMITNIQATNTSPVDPPEGVTFPYGFIQFDVQTVETLETIVGEGQQAQITIKIPLDRRINSFWKTDSDGNWHKLGRENQLVIRHTSDGTYISFVLNDNDLLDEDPRTGIIRDLGGAGIEEHMVENVPSLTEWGMIIFSLLALTLGIIYLRKRQMA